MMAFFTRCWRSWRLDGLGLLLCASLGGLAAVPARAEGLVPEVGRLKVERIGDGLVLAANVAFELPASVEDALRKGVPVFFVLEAEVYRERWYWLDRKVGAALRQLRLMYQPLTQRWRLGVTNGPATGPAPAAYLNRHFDTLDEALTAIRNITGWRIAETADIEHDVRHRIEFRFRLDVSQLPRPLQIGVLGQDDWNVVASATQRLTLEKPR